MKGELTDKERILIEVIRRLAHKATAYYASEKSIYSGYLECVDDALDLKSGDLVLCNTSGIGRWTIAWVVEPVAYSECILREIGSQATCRMGNEGFKRIVGLSPLALLEGPQREFFAKVGKAFKKTRDYGSRFGGLEFDEKEAVIWIREVFDGSLSGPADEESVPYPVRMRWNRRTPIRAIIEAMRAEGYPERKFARRKKQPEATPV